MAFGQHIARLLLPVMGGFFKLPASASRLYADTLAAASRPYNWVNYAGSIAGARVSGLRLARRWMRRDTEQLLAWGAGATDAQLASDMSCDHLRAQLTVDSADSPPTGPSG